ncbi:permease protein of ABC transporter [Azotobacter vinelandii CA]|uniref:Permease protein of ABC transporter n=2 Tax=Azotobacter vinelandii TaxID=354 RepID=C1DMK0_AZOVD|nr:ABC transporter permease [Azotobacter vinelandii]ACO81277.1 permease protein of ABC transporter [Azotobacter vinelandii DJ]AGK15748.1 permease protein of ABC transporter [Azotobacter vinelandii CA]AGK22448.1 permease protein of ABC transporter [Azotobacter vinelandii CA6]SFX28578.1 putative ABC transport system permease protein [Azotobacter vinelandii]GLK59292.1 ABC transporter permease [Azotobacter vinelandii]
MRPDARPGWGLLAALASRDLWHDRQVSLCIVAALVAVIAPLLLLFGLKHGVVLQLRGELLDDPRNLEIRLLGNHDLDRAWFAHLAAQPGVGFVMPLTRSLNTQADLARDSQRFVADAEVIPSGPGDPLLGTRLAPPEGDRVLLSASAARRLEVGAGERIRLAVLRKLDGNSERGQRELTVAGVLPETAFSRPALLVPLDLLVAMEDFRDGFAVPALGFAAGRAPPPRERYARARVYAGSLDDVAPLAAWLEGQRIETGTRLREIESVKAVDRVLGLIFAVIAWTAAIGCVASLAGAFLANIDRKRKDLALLRLLGFRRIAVGAYVMVQAALLTSLAFALGYLAYLAGSTVFNRALGANLAADAFVCRLENLHILLAFASALLIAILVAAVGGYRAIHIQPAESLRDL